MRKKIFHHVKKNHIVLQKHLYLMKVEKFLFSHIRYIEKITSVTEFIKISHNNKMQLNKI